MGATLPDQAVTTERNGGGVLATIDRVLDNDGGALLTVDGSADELSALGRHVARRARSLGRPFLRVDGRFVDEPWREAASRLGLDALADAATLARRLSRALGDGLLIVHVGSDSAWGESVAEEMTRLASSSSLACVVVVLGGARVTMRELAEGRAAPKGTHLIRIPTPLGEHDVARFWDALAQEQRNAIAGFDRLESVERWWAGARAGGRSRAALLSREARALFARLSMLRRSCRTAVALTLGNHATKDELVDAGWLEADGDRLLVLGPTSRGATPQHGQVRDTAEDAALVARALVEHESDPWALLRAAELHSVAGERDLAHAQARAALCSAPDAAARSDFWHRLETLTDAATQDELTAYAELALELGDVEPALAMARRAASHEVGTKQGFRLALALGRARRARGDAPGASASLAQALELASDPADRASASVEIADLALSNGDIEAARTRARVALDAGADASFLAARNVLGKALLAEGRWSDAERHFADDESEASCRRRDGDALRSRVNRAIAVMSAGRRGEARALFESVLEDGTRTGDRRASAFALANLSTLATLAHDYEHALCTLDRAIDEVRAMGDKSRFARLVLNLADLRLRIGLVDEAEQALAFARHACGRAVLGEVAALLGFVAARVELARGNTLSAAADIEDAIAAAVRSSNGAKLGECHRLGVRIALEDGDVERAERHWNAAQACPGGPDAAADNAVLRAMLARASGSPYRDPAFEALSLASAAADLELSRQARVLCSTAARLTGATDQADEHLDAARRLRDTVAATLPEALRKSYLARRDMVELDVCVVETPPRVRRSANGGQPARTLVGRSRAMRSLCESIEKVGRSDATVLIAGESGTGKELVADAIHAASTRSGGPLVKINCAALVETLLLSELFGHEKGAFTGASSRKIGRFEQAHGGTLFLDEIGDISPNTQVALLRVLQERVVERVGGSRSIEVDVRVICATHRDLPRLVEEGRFREDLYYRLSCVTLPVPPLRERLEDLPDIARALVERMAAERATLCVSTAAPKGVSTAAPKAKQLTGEALEALARHTWPGNVRELENALRAGALFADGPAIGLRDLLDNVEGLRHLGLARSEHGSERPSRAPEAHVRFGTGPDDLVYDAIKSGTSLPDMKRAMERACIERALEEAGGNITHAAQLLGMKRPRLSQLVNQYAKDGLYPEVAK